MFSGFRSLCAIPKKYMKATHYPFGGQIWYWTYWDIKLFCFYYCTDSNNAQAFFECQSNVKIVITSLTRQVWGYCTLMVIIQIKYFADFFEQSYPCYARNLEHWQCPARPHWLPAHWSGVSCECAPRSTLKGRWGEEWVHQLHFQRILNKPLATHQRLWTCIKINKEM